MHTHPIRNRIRTDETLYFLQVFLFELTLLFLALQAYAVQESKALAWSYLTS